MNSRRHLGLVAGAATVLASAPISDIFAGWTWLFEGGLLVAMVTGAALGARSLRGRLWAQLLAMLGALLIGLTWLFGDGTAILGLIPTPDTFAEFGRLFALAGEEVQKSYVPVPDLDGLLFVSALGMGAVAILVDLCAVGLRRPALAGLPMLAIYSVPVAVYVDSLSPVPFIVGAIGFLWLLVSDNVDRVRRFGRRFTGEGRGVDVWEPSPLASAGRRLAVVGVLVAVALPLAVPAMSAGFLGDFGSGDGLGQAGKGPRGNGRVDLFAELSGRLKQAGVQDMVKVTTNDPDPFYMRFGVADQISGGGFASRQPTGQPVSDNLPDPSGLDLSSVRSQAATARVEITENFAMPLLPVYAAPTAVRGLDAAWSYDPSLQIVYSQRANSAEHSYEFDYVRAEFTPDQLRTAPIMAASDSNQREFSRVPEVSEVRTLVDKLVEGKANNYDRVRALYDYFSAKNDFRYDVAAPAGTSGAAIVDFLNNKRGFCEQYAAALAWMVRTAGIPARVAFGFTLGSSSDNGVRTLTNRNLHAWTEVYFSGFGWVPFDATPSTYVVGSAPTAWAPDVDAPEEVPGGARPSLSPGATDGSAGPGGPTRDPIDPDGGVAGPITLDNELPTWVWVATGGVVLLLALLIAPALRRTMLRRRRGVRAAVAASGGDFADVGVAVADLTMTVVTDTDAARRQAHAAWDELIDTMIDHRLVVDPAETPRATVERLISTALPASAAVEQARLLGMAEERARYAPVPLAADRLTPAVRAVRRAIAGEADRGVRLTALLMPPSVLLRWRNAAFNGFTTLSDRLARLSGVGKRVLRPLRPGRLLR
ncbi:transglutaminase TgpA family protein [Catellatospora methionotrophica]|uniref:transglutaminase TgpA family protein n=1 Tax=Catellatospora methionotrophica TaxID=121620 RepID=UPI0033E84D6E